MNFNLFSDSKFYLPILTSNMVIFLALTLNPLHIDARAAAPITPSGLNTQVSPPVTLPGGQTQYNITGGTRPGGGTNLFHSFGDFNVPTNNIANFLNNSGLPCSGIPGCAPPAWIETSHFGFGGFADPAVCAAAIVGAANMKDVNAKIARQHASAERH